MAITYKFFWELEMLILASSQAKIGNSCTVTVGKSIAQLLTIAEQAGFRSSEMNLFGNKTVPIRGVFGQALAHQDGY